MSKKLLTVLLVFLLLLTACNQKTEESNPQDTVIEDYADKNDALSKENSELSAKLEENTEELDKLRKDYDSLIEEYNAIKENYRTIKSDYAKMLEDYSAYKERMQEYEKLEADELEARQIAAAKAIAEEEERQRKEEEEEAKKREAEEKKGYNTGITYQQLARTPGDYEGEKIKFTGKVVQVIDGDDEIHIRLAVNGNYDSIILCGYESDLLEFRILENDQITIYGVSMGLYSYESTMGKTVTIPCAWVDKIDLKSSR